MYVQKIKTSHIPWPALPLKYYFETYIFRLSQQEFFSFKIMGFDTKLHPKDCNMNKPHSYYLHGGILYINLQNYMAAKPR